MLSNQELEEELSSKRTQFIPVLHHYSCLTISVKAEVKLANEKITIFKLHSQDQAFHGK